LPSRRTRFAQGAGGLPDFAWQGWSFGLQSCALGREIWLKQGLKKLKKVVQKSEKVVQKV
jgi:hypothetical protein